MSGDETSPVTRHRDLARWIAGRRSEVERYVEEACHRAIVKARSVAAEEIRSLSKRVERMHGLLDNLERLVETREERGDGPASPPRSNREGEGA